MIDPRLIATYVINLPRRPDRRAWMERQLPPGSRAVFTSDLKIDNDGNGLSEATLADRGISLFDWQIDSPNPWWNRPLKFGEIGCTLAHLACWRHALENTSTPYILILEDDAVFSARMGSDLLRGLALITAEREPFDLLYLGRYLLEPDTPTAIPGVVRPGYSHCTFAYLMTRAGTETAMNCGLDQAIIPIDEFLPSLYLPHPRADVRETFPPRVSALAFEPPLVTQRPKDEAGSDTEDSDFVGALGRLRRSR
ncbi:glycosyltransferase family 25 protein [Nocardia camponoti]|uniref:Glycosyl transferase family 25 domain-containing protein n=1 Tax=Nocardia camponoti TaxID=1616106 RepID=A0A917QCK4_9NOCA|nr:glycosyltransferase family 25 protein [Nocardia camponoti]GGK43633.1 hypothetical protein GCM10011591_14060 [Nocardia camponoti]